MPLRCFRGGDIGPTFVHAIREESPEGSIVDLKNQEVSVHTVVFGSRRDRFIDDPRAIVETALPSIRRYRVLSLCSIDDVACFQGIDTSPRQAFPYTTTTCIFIVFIRGCIYNFTRGQLVHAPTSNAPNDHSRDSPCSSATRIPSSGSGSTFRTIDRTLFDSYRKKFTRTITNSSDTRSTCYARVVIDIYNSTVISAMIHNSRRKPGVEISATASRAKFLPHDQPWLYSVTQDSGNEFLKTPARGYWHDRQVLLGLFRQRRIILVRRRFGDRPLRSRQIKPG